MENNETMSLDLMQILRSCLRKWWLIALAGILAGALGFCYAAFFVEPTYASSVTLYVNNSKDTDKNVTSSDLTASQSLVKTYCEILNNRTTLQMVIERANLSCTYQELSKMITSGALNDTEVMKVTVTTNDADEAAAIANCIAEVLPVRISAIINGATMEVVDSAVPNYRKVAPSIPKYTLLGFVVGFVLALGTVVVLTMLDDTIHGEEYLLQTYGVPILASIPDLHASGNRRYGYYYKSTSQKNS